MPANRVIVFLTQTSQIVLNPVVTLLEVFSSMTSVMSVLNFSGFLLSSGMLPCASTGEDLLPTQNDTLNMACPKLSE